MSVLRKHPGKPVVLQLRRDLVRTIKRGHCWVYADALRSLPKATPGSPAILLDNRGGREVGKGFYDPNGQIALRICTTNREVELSNAWALGVFNRAIQMRKTLFGNDTTGFRLFNGEGDGLPGLICDLYSDSAVLSLDGDAAYNFWDVMEISDLLADRLALTHVYERTIHSKDNRGRILYGTPARDSIDFLENGLNFTASPLKGHKTGFYLDQRDNRRRIQDFVAGKEVLNLFGYTGGFSVYAGKAGASHVTTVDAAQPALTVAEKHWSMNGLKPVDHTVLCEDVFKYLADASRGTAQWDLVILDPPSFAPSERVSDKALGAYTQLISGAAAITRNDGILAASSCSSHVTMEDFITACREGISRARKQATVLGIFRQPSDHPAPLAMPELWYLKFVIMMVHD